MGDLKRKLAELEEICGKLESTLQKTSSSEGGGKIGDMLKELDSRKKFQKTTKKLMNSMRMTNAFGGGSKKGGSQGSMFGGGKAAKVEGEGEGEGEGEVDKIVDKVVVVEKVVDVDAINILKQEMELKVQQEAHEAKQKLEKLQNEQAKLRADAKSEKEAAEKKLSEMQAKLEAQLAVQREEGQQKSKSAADEADELRQKQTILLEDMKLSEEKRVALELRLKEEAKNAELERKQELSRKQQQFDDDLNKMAIQNEEKLKQMAAEQHKSSHKSSIIGKIGNFGTKNLMNKKLGEKDEKIASAEKEAEELKIELSRLKLKSEAEDTKKQVEKEKEEENEFGKGLAASEKAQLVKELLIQRKGMENMASQGSSVAKRRTMEVSEQINKLRKDLEDYGGWKPAILLSGGSVDLEFDLEPWPMKQQVEILLTMKKFLEKKVTEEAKEASKAFFEVDGKRELLEKSLNKSEKNVEKQRSTVLKLRHELEELENRMKAGEEKSRIEAEKLDNMTNKGGAGGELTKDELQGYVRGLKREQYRERLAVSELLRVIDEFYHGVGELTIDREEGEILDRLIEEQVELEIKGGGNNEAIMESRVEEIGAVGRPIAVLLQGEEGRRKIDRGKFGLSTRKGSGTPPGKKREIIQPQPRGSRNMRPKTAPGGRKNEKLAKLRQQKKLYDNKLPPPLKKTPDLMAEELATVSLIPFVLAKKKAIPMLAKFLDRRILLGKNWRDFEGHLSQLDHLDKIETLAKNANRKLLHHQKEVGHLDGYLNGLLKGSVEADEGEIERYSNECMSRTQHANQSLLDYNESVLKKTAILEGTNSRLLRPQSAVPLFVSRGEYFETKMLNSNPNPIKYK